MPSHPLQRKDDTQENRAVWKKEVGHGRWRTVVYSMVASGIVAAVIGYIVETNIYNNERENLITTCNLVNEDRRSSGEYLDQQADNVLGDPKENTESLKFKGTSLEEFRALIIRQAHANRKRSEQYFGRVEDCRSIFPKRDYITWIN
jgi:hypothetical protein